MVRGTFRPCSRRPQPSSAVLRPLRGQRQLAKPRPTSMSNANRGKQCLRRWHLSPEYLLHLRVAAVPLSAAPTGETPAGLHPPITGRALGTATVGRVKRNAVQGCAPLIVVQTDLQSSKMTTGEVPGSWSLVPQGRICTPPVRFRALLKRGDYTVACPLTTPREWGFKNPATV